MNVIFEVNGIPIRKICLISDRHDFIVHEQELKENKRDGSFDWDPIFMSNHNNFSYAHNEFIGRIVKAGWENGNQGGK